MVLDVSHASVRLRRTLNVVGARIGDGSTGLRVEAARRGGHAALPHMGVDAILVGAELVTALQSIVARTFE